MVCTLFNGTPPSGKVVTPDLPITYDPHFVVGARVESVVQGKAPWPPGTSLRFLIHSPSLMLPASFSGQRFRLTFSPFRPHTKDELVWFEPNMEYLLRWLEPVP